MALAVVQHASDIRPNEVPGAITLGSAPTLGDLVVVFMHCNTSIGSVTVNTSGWTVFEDVNNLTQQLGFGLYRYVQPGDTSTLPVLWSAGSTYWAYEVYEISGVTGVFAADIPHHSSTFTGPTTPVTSLTLAGIATGSVNALALCGAGQYDGNHTPTLSGGWTVDESGHNVSNYGSQVGGSQTAPSPGTSVGVTASFTDSSDPADLILAIVESGVSGSPNVTVVLIG